MQLREKLLGSMTTLGLYGMKASFDELIAAGIKQRATPEKILLELLTAELAERRVRSIRYRMGQARFPVDKDLDQFDFSQSPVNEPQIRRLYEGNFLAETSNIILVGGTGSGKTHLAIAIARQAIRNGKRGRYFNLLDLVNQLEQEKLNARGGKLAESLARLDFVVLDELGYLPFSKAGGHWIYFNYFHRYVLAPIISSILIIVYVIYMRCKDNNSCIINTYNMLCCYYLSLIRNDKPCP